MPLSAEEIGTMITSYSKRSLAPEQTPSRALVSQEAPRSSTIRKILFPVDFSVSCVGMAAYVKQAAEIFSAEVTLMHVCDLESHNGFELYVRTPNEISQEHWEVGRNKLDGFLTSQFPTGTCSRILLAGEVSNLIVSTAKENNADLIIMPTHAGRFRRMLLGSTTAKVLDEAHCPVLTTQHAARIAPRPVEHKTWLCGIELNSDAERVFRIATNAALQAGAQLSVIHVIPTSGIGTMTADEQLARGWISELERRLRSDAPVLILHGAIKEQLLNAAKESSADVLVIGRKLRNGAFGRVRDLSYSVIRDSPCPVVSV